VDRLGWWRTIRVMTVASEMLFYRSDSSCVDLSRIYPTLGWGTGRVTGLKIKLVCNSIALISCIALLLEFAVSIYA